MTGSHCRLLAFFSLIFFVPSVPAQDAVAIQSLGPVLAPTSHQFSLPPLSLSAPSGSSWHAPVAGPISFPQLVQKAGIIFSGHVLSVGRTTDRGASASNQPADATTITFLVEHAFRGAFSGQTLTIHEWSGLASGRERCRVGEHVFLFLYPPSKLGLTSPVAGAMGRFSISARGNVEINTQNGSSLAADPVIAGRHLVAYADFVRALHRATGEE
jgi:hypothetical protein